jgi:hypothetical protein
MSAALQLPAPTGLSARYQGPGSANFTTTWYYWLQALYPEGWSELSAPANTGAYAPASLTPDAINNVQWNPTPGALGYLLYRNTTGTTPGYGATAIFIATSETGFKDNGVPATFVNTPRFDAIYVARAIYNFAVDGGTEGAIIPAISDTIPANAIVWGGWIMCSATVTGSTDIEVGTSAGSSATSILASTAVPTTGEVIKATADATPFAMSAAGQIQFTFTAANATAGVLECVVFYSMPVTTP